VEEASNMSFPIIGREQAESLIPTEAAQQVIAAAAQASVALQLCRRQPMTTRDFEQPVMSELAESYWIKSGELKKLSSAAWDGILLHSEELATIVVADIDVIEDASINLWNALTPELGSAIARKVDAAVLSGLDKPDSWPPSIYEGAVAAGQVVPAVSTPAQGAIYNDLANVLDALETMGIDPTGYAARRGVRGLLRRARNAQGDMLGPMDLGTAWDLPFTWALPGTLPEDALALVGEWAMAIVGIRQEMRVEMFSEGVIQGDDGEIVANLLQQDRRALRVTFRCGFAVANPVRRVEGGDERAFPFAVLQAGAQEPATAGGSRAARKER
jgi:HK97 family phage major capsid protein